jgi:hypothetical protein
LDSFLLKSMALKTKEFFNGYGSYCSGIEFVVHQL